MRCPPFSRSWAYNSAICSAAVVTEKIFAWPGIGTLAVQSISRRDFPMLQTIVLLGSALVLTISLITDIVYTLIDPRLSYGKEE